MTVGEAAELVLKESGGTLHARDIYASIQERQLYQFNTKDPISVVSSALRQRQQVTKTGPNTFTLRITL